MPTAELELPEANVMSGDDPFPADRYVTIANVPVFAEHETKARDGRVLRFTRRELEAVCQRCNRRISDTGDYAAISLGHTPDPDSSAPQPEIVGFAGPFRIGMVGAAGRQKYAILADFHVLREDYPKLKRYPRRSPELWLEDRYEEMFLDPIALLGAEAPRLDMGLTALYTASRGGRLVEKYAAAGPAAGNAFIPTDRYAATTQGASSMPNLTPEDIQQIADVIEQLDVFQWAKGKMSEEAGSNASTPPPAAPAVPPAAPGAVPPVPGAPPPAAAGMPVPAAPGAEPPPGLPPVAPPEAAGPPMAPPPEGPPPEAPGEGPPPDLGEPPMPEGADAEALGEEPPGPEEADSPPEPDGDEKAVEPPEGPAEEEDEEAKKKAKYAAADSMDDDEFQKYCSERAAKKKAKYAAEQGDVAPDGKGVATANVVEGESGASTGSVVPGGEKYAKVYDQLQRIAKRADMFEADLAIEREKRVNAERYSRLTSLRQCLAFDLDEEREKTKYGKLTDDQFKEYTDTLEKYCPAIPLNAPFPPVETGLEAHRVGSKEKYTKAHHERAMQLIRERTANYTKPIHVDFMATLEEVASGKVK